MSTTAITTAQVESPFAQQRQPLATVNVESQRAVAEVQAAIFLARQNPRDQPAAMERILNACCRPTLADGATYEFSKGVTEISAPSIRLAECLAQNWGNMRSGIIELSRGTRDGKTFSEAKAYAWDCETNFYDEKIFQVTHWRDTKQGGYALKDEREIYELVANQGARRKRACILAVIPGDVAETAVQQCETTMKTKAEVTPDSIKRTLQAFEKYQVTREQIETWLSRKMDAMKPAQLIRLRKIYASLEDGMSKPKDWFNGGIQKASPNLFGGPAVAPFPTEENSPAAGDLSRVPAAERSNEQAVAVTGSAETAGVDVSPAVDSSRQQLGSVGQPSRLASAPEGEADGNVPSQSSEPRQTPTAARRRTPKPDAPPLVLDAENETCRERLKRRIAQAGLDPAKTADWLANQLIPPVNEMSELEASDCLAAFAEIQKFAAQ